MPEDDQKPFSRKAAFNLLENRSPKPRKRRRESFEELEPQPQLVDETILQALLLDEHYEVPLSALQTPSLIMPDLKSIVLNTIPMQDITPFPAPTPKRRRVRQKKPSDAEYKFKCMECDNSYQRKENLQRHINAVHHKTEWCECLVCHERTSRVDNIKAHIKRMHKDADPDRDYIIVNIEEEERLALEGRDALFDGFDL